MCSASASSFDAVTVDAFGTLIVLEDPAVRLREALARHGVERNVDAIRRAFRAEASYYRPRSLRGRDETSLSALRRDCIEVFLREADAELDPAAFVADFVGSLVFEPIAGARDALESLRAAGLGLACVANWDVSLHDVLERLELRACFSVVVTSADAGAEKPYPAIFSRALEQLGVAPERALHVGDERADRLGAHAAGLAFEPVPLSSLPNRLGLRAAS